MSQRGNDNTGVTDKPPSLQELRLHLNAMKALIVHVTHDGDRAEIQSRIDDLATKIKEFKPTI